MNTKPIIEKWYRMLKFPEIYDREFYAALNSIEIPAEITLEDCDLKSADGKRNLLTFLYLCEQTRQKAAAIGIPESVTVDTLRDIVIWTENHTGRKGELYLGELGWLANHMSLKLFRLGRLQFCMEGAFQDIPEANVAEGDPVLEIHIPRGGKLDIEACKASIFRAGEFFARFFPEYRYRCMTCWSWLLDDTLREYLPETSNIIRFGNLFTKVYSKEKNALLKYVFPIDTTETNLADAASTTVFAQSIKEAILAGKKFHETLGFIPNVREQASHMSAAGIQE